MYHDIVKALLDVKARFLDNVVFRAKIFTRKAFLSSLHLDHVKSLGLLHEDIPNPDGTMNTSTKKLIHYQKHRTCFVEIPNKFEDKWEERKKRAHDSSLEKTKASKKQK